MIKQARTDSTVRFVAAGAGMLALAMGCASEANAGCGQPPTAKPGAFWQGQGSAFGNTARFIRASFDTGSSEAEDNRDSRFSPLAVVGLWKYSFTAEGKSIDWGYQAYHGDGTEEQSSGARPPATGYTCVGVWDRVAYHHYKLSHFAYNWDAAGTTYLGQVVIKEDITVDEAGNHMTGTFSLTAYKLDGKTPYGPALQGTVTADRVLAE